MYLPRDSCLVEPYARNFATQREWGATNIQAHRPIIASSDLMSTGGLGRTRSFNFLLVDPHPPIPANHRLVRMLAPPGEIKQSWRTHSNLDHQRQSFLQASGDDAP